MSYAFRQAKHRARVIEATRSEHPTMPVRRRAGPKKFQQFFTIFLTGAELGVAWRHASWSVGNHRHNRTGPVPADVYFSEEARSMKRSLFAFGVFVLGAVLVAGTIRVHAQFGPPSPERQAAMQKQMALE